MERQFTPAGFWIRLLAHILDGLVLLIPNLIVMFTLGFHAHLAMFQLSCTALVIVYMVGFQSSSWQATPGKRLLNIYIIRAETGGKISRSRALARYLVLYGLHLLFICTMSMTGNFVPPPSSLTPDEQKEYVMLTDKRHNLKLSTEESQRVLFLTFLKLANPDDLSQGEKDTFEHIRTKLQQHETLTEEESLALSRMTLGHILSGKKILIIVLLLVELLYWFIIALAIGLTHNKTGLHDMICHTRAVRGRPDEQPMPA